MLDTISSCLVGLVYVFLALLGSELCCCGLPGKTPQHPSIKVYGCSTRWCVFLGVLYAFIYFSTDQYIPSLPAMQLELGGSQGFMTGAVQMNLCVKAISGMLTAGLSDRVGRRPVLVMCTFLLSVASLCCGGAGCIGWFMGAQVLQAIGESMEPVLFAMVRDCFSDSSQRFTMIAALQMMAFVGIAVAPVFGGFSMQLASWRVSFFVLAVIWGIFAIVASFMVESCPDTEKHQSYCKDLSRILDSHCLCLLLTESFIMSAYFTFNANVSYLAESVFGQSEMMSAAIMLLFGVVNGIGAFLIDRLRLGLLRSAQLALTFLTLSGLVSLVLGSILPESMWLGYILGSILQASGLMMGLVSVNVLFFEPLQDCAGMAASFEILAQSVVPSIWSAVSTQFLIHDGSRGLTIFQAVACALAGLTFWVGYGCNPPRAIPTMKEPLLTP